MIARRVPPPPAAALGGALVFVVGGARLRVEIAAACALRRGPRRLAPESSARLRPRLPGGDAYPDDRAPDERPSDGSLLEYAGAAGD